MGKILESGIWLFSLALLLVHCDLGGGPNPLWTCFPSAYFVRLHDLPGPLEAKGMHSHVPQCASWGGGELLAQNPQDRGDIIIPFCRPGNEV